MDLKKQLQRFYLLLLLPALAANIIFYLFAFHPDVLFSDFMKAVPYGTAGTVLLVMSASFSLALPLFYRSLFAGTVRGRTSITGKEFMRFQKRLLCIGLATPYVSACAILFRFSGLYLYGPVLLSLYSLYFYFPSKKRIDYDIKLFRVRDDERDMA